MSLSTRRRCSGWKATFMVEFEDAGQRQLALQSLLGIESKVWVEVDGCGRIYTIADEDLERATADKTSAVHFLRFQLNETMCNAIVNSAVAVRMGIDHDHYRYSVELPDSTRAALRADLG